MDRKELIDVCEKKIVCYTSREVNTRKKAVD